MPGGRPSKYDPSLGDEVENLMRQGYSKTAAAGHIGISRDTLLEWTSQYPEFSGAVRRGEAARTLKLETDLLAATSGPMVTSRIFALKNAAPDEWKDKREVDNTSSDGSMTPVSIDYSKLSPQALKELHRAIKDANPQDNGGGTPGD